MIFQLRDEETDKTKSIELDCTSEDFIEYIQENEAYHKVVNKLETTYGVLDFDGDGETSGYNSYEIEREFFNLVFSELVKEITKTFSVK